MVFSDTTTSSGLIQDITFLTGADVNSYTLADRVRNVNANYHKVVSMILQSQDEWDFDDKNFTDYPILTTSLVANQQDYSFPASVKLLKVKRVEITYDGINFYKAEPFDINERGLATDAASLSRSFVTTKPYYDIQSNSLFLYPKPASNSTNGLKVWISREIDEFTASDTTQEPAFDEPFHRMLSIGASLDFAVAKGSLNKNDLAALLADYEARLRQYYGSKQTDRNYILKPAFISYD